MLANEIAKLAVRDRTFPRFEAAHVRDGIKLAERRLATEVVSAYNSVYPKVGQILDALSGIPAVFPGKELDKRAPQTASVWPKGEYSPLRFRQVMSELGVVGRVRHHDPKAQVAAVDFAYATEGRLPLLAGDTCAIHPMFFDKLRIDMNPAVRIYPFPDHPEFVDLNHRAA